MFREKIKVVDCTVRDGGLINNWQFSDDFVRAVFKALSAAGVDYMEMGYIASKKMFSPTEFGKWKFCDEKDIKKIIGDEKGNMKLSAMVDIDRVEFSDILPKEKSSLDMIRVATYVQDIDKAIALVNHIHEKGYETTINIMAISKALETELNEALEQLNKTPVKVVYIVDSFGALYSEPIQYLVKKYKKYLPDKEVGIHAHNNQQLAFGNTIEGIIYDVNFCDATIYGIGRAAGNCPLELLIAFLKNPKFHIEPIFDVIEKEFLPLRKKIEWGYLIPYMITGVLNEHPRSAMALRNSERKNKFFEFHKEMIDLVE
jgi:4-hydroxy 2-oxovalerate aldolase